jgi:GH15 family glucan-1,4-alpha-glucosidase
VLRAIAAPASCGAQSGSGTRNRASHCAHGTTESGMTNWLENYGMIGDGQSAALVSRDGSVDWLCWPRFDSDACFAALLGRETRGYWRIAPHGRYLRSGWRYREGTLLLETDFSVGGGSMRVLDFMPVRDDASPALVRQVTGLSGEVTARMELRIRFDYGQVPPWAELQNNRYLGRVGPDLVVLYADAPLERDGHDAVATFTIREGDTINFVLRHGQAVNPPPDSIDVARAIEGTERYWRDWIGRFDKNTDWPQAVKRSLLTLKALINRPTGGMVAAPSCSLPEVPGGTMNWDYRYCWLRDSTFTLAALINAGYTDEGRAWRDWMLRAIAGTPEHIQIMYRIDGDRELQEVQAPWLCGYDWSTPVNIGNAASRQKQLDIYGELIDALHLADRAGIERTEHSKVVERAIVEHLEENWQDAGHGIWESRGDPKRYVYSKVMAWVAIDRFLKRSTSAGEIGDDVRKRLVALRQTIHDEVMQEGYNPGLDCFVQHYGGQEIDASLLLIPTVGFLPADDPRVKSTVARIERDLVSDGLVYRTVKSREQGAGAFLACSAWLADCYQLQGRMADARAAFERLLSVRNELGLLSEEYNIPAQRLVGNFPQALSHLALVTTGIGLCDDVYQRGGG